MMGRTGDTILTVVEKGDHAIRVHVLASVELVVLEVGDDLLSERLRALLKGLYALGLRLLELRLDGLHVALEVGEESLLVEGSRLQTEGVDDVVDRLRALLERAVLIVLGRGVGAWCSAEV